MVFFVNAKMIELERKDFWVCCFSPQVEQQTVTSKNGENPTVTCDIDAAEKQ